MRSQALCLAWELARNLASSVLPTLPLPTLLHCPQPISILPLPWSVVFFLPSEHAVHTPTRVLSEGGACEPLTARAVVRSTPLHLLRRHNVQTAQIPPRHQSRQGSTGRYLYAIALELLASPWRCNGLAVHTLVLHHRRRTHNKDMNQDAALMMPGFLSLLQMKSTRRRSKFAPSTTRYIPTSPPSQTSSPNTPRASYC